MLLRILSARPSAGISMATLRWINTYECVQLGHHDNLEIGEDLCVGICNSGGHFLILWLVEKQKQRSYENLKAAKAAADAYVNQKKVRVTVYTRPNTAKRLDYYWKRPKRR